MELPNKVTGAPRFSVRGRAGIRTPLVRSTVAVGGCRSVLSLRVSGRLGHERDLTCLGGRRASGGAV
jgi:hypothetical protein